MQESHTAIPVACQCSTTKMFAEKFFSMRLLVLGGKTAPMVPNADHQEDLVIIISLENKKAFEAGFPWTIFCITLTKTRVTSRRKICPAPAIVDTFSLLESTNRIKGTDRSAVFERRRLTSRLTRLNLRP